jgi:competence protein ComEC
LQPPFNPPGFDYRAYLAGQGIHAVMSFPTVTVDGHGVGNPIQAFAYGLRDALRWAILGMLPHDMAALLIGILLGAPTRSLGTLTVPFIRAGLIHVVAISGLKVALVAGTVSRLSSRLPARVRPFPALGAVGLYTLVSGATPSGLRAALMWGLAVIALSLGRRSDVWVSLAAVAAAMLWWNPLLLHDVGFQLSVTGTAGIVAFTLFFERRLHVLPPILRESTAVTLAAQVATLPLTMAGFGQISLIGPLANGLLLPLLGPIMALGGLTALIAIPLPAMGHLLAYALYPWLALFSGLTQLLASLPFAATPPLPLSGWMAGAYYGGLLIVSRRLAPSSATQLRLGPLTVLARRPARFLAVGLLAIAVALFIARPPARASIWLEGVGGDQVLLLQTPSGQAILIDGGQNPALLQAIIGAHLPFWQRDLTAVLVSQPDSHHIGGLVGLSTLYRIGEEFDPGAVYPSITYARWHGVLRDAGVRERHARTGMRLDLGAGDWIDVLAPDVVNLDDPIAPVAYRLHLGRQIVLVVNRQAVDGDPAMLQADGDCLDSLVLPDKADPINASALVRTLKPRLVALPQDGSVIAADLAPLPKGTRTWLAGEGAELALSSQSGACGV